MKIINDRFEVGQKYRGMVNGVVLTVAKIQEAGTYETPQGWQITVSRTQIHFRDKKNGAIFHTELETAKRLLLELVE